MSPELASAAYDAEPSVAADRASNEAEIRLVERAKVDREAFGELYHAHAPEILRYVRRRAGDAAIAEDLLAETFLRALRGIGRYRAQGVPFRFWLYRIATNVVNTWTRRRRWRGLLFGENAIEPAAAVEPRGTGAHAIEARAALAALSTSDQTILVLRFVEELSIEEVARVLGCPPGTVQSRTARARERLRRRLERSERR